MDFTSIFKYKFLTLIYCLLFFYLPEISAQSNDETSSLNIGGAIRYNLFLTSYESDMDANSSQFTWDTWRINILYDNPEGIGLNFEYRFYPTFGTHFIKQGWLEYHFSEHVKGQLGVTQVPFGNLPYNSNNWWFSLPYYVGLEDDHDMGVKLTRTTDNWQWDVAWFFQAEPEGPSFGGESSFGVGGNGRYSYDIIPEENASLTERNQFNIRGAYQFLGGEFGGSVQYGGLYNTETARYNHQFAAAVHSDLNIGRFNIKPQILYYTINAVDDANNRLSTVFMGAYASSYEVSARAWLATLGLAYSYDINWGPVTNINFYNDFSYMQNKTGKGTTLRATGDELTLGNHFQPAVQNITGCMVTAGPVFTYFDIAQGINHPWLTDHFGVGAGPGHEDLGLGASEYNIRFNINIGFYF